jgi:hypothetical protein
LDTTATAPQINGPTWNIPTVPMVPFAVTFTDGAASIDEMTFEILPEPGAAGLALLIGTLAMAHRRPR